MPIGPHRVQRAPEDAALRAMFAARKRVFIDILRWDLPVLAGEYELDQFDTPDAEYLILLGEDGRHRASARLLRTEGAHLLGEVYAHLCDGPPPRGAHVREITRFCLDPDLGAPERRIARNQLVSALAEHALACGITDYTGVAQFGWLRQILAFGWQCAPLGPLVREGGSSLAALHIRIDRNTVAGLARTGIYQPRALALACRRAAA